MKLFVGIFLTTLQFSMYGSQPAPINIRRYALPKDSNQQEEIFNHLRSSGLITTELSPDKFIAVSDEVRAKIEQWGITPAILALPLITAKATRTERPREHSDSWAKGLFAR